MKESQSHQAFAKWLDKNRIPFVHSRTDKRHTNAVGDPDFFCFLAGRVLAVEFKVGRNKLSVAQRDRIAYLNAAGNRTVVAYSLEEAVQAVEAWCGVEKPSGEALGPYEQHDWSGLKEKVRTAGMKPAKEPKAKKQPDLPVNGNGHRTEPFYIARWNERDYVMARAQNGNYDMIRQASAADVINLPKLPA